MTQPPQELLDYGAARAEFWKNPPRGKCAEDGCLEESPILHTGADGLGRCATHYTARTVRQRDYPCDRCGAGPAFRDPAHRLDIMLCAECHESEGYVPGERAMVSQSAVRQGVTHSMARRVKCAAAGYGTECRGEIKQRGSRGMLCSYHADPKKYLAAKGG